MKFINYKGENYRNIGFRLNRFGIEDVTFEYGYRGVLLWFVTDKYVHVFGHWSEEYTKAHEWNWFERWTFDKWENDHTDCG